MVAPHLLKVIEELRPVIWAVMYPYAERRGEKVVQYLSRRESFRCNCMHPESAHDLDCGEVHCWDCRLGGRRYTARKGKFIIGTHLNA